MTHHSIGGDGKMSEVLVTVLFKTEAAMQILLLFLVLLLG
jgi:hypothetical protein